MLIDDLLAYVFDGQSHLLAPPVAMWLASSRRFTTFVATFRDKIRKKIRATQDQESLLDLRLELETAYLLLHERSLSVVYEPEQSRQERHPDFAVTFTTSLTFMVEVTRLRAEQSSLADAVSPKLGQLRPQCGNVLLIGAEAPRLTHSDVRSAMLCMQQRAERSDPAFLRRRGFRDRADFFRHYGRLSEVLVRGSPLESGTPVVVWVNPQAKHPLPPKVHTALSRSHTL